jgi:hypothetical protein
VIILLGASGYFGQAFEQELLRRQSPYRPVSRKQIDYTRFDALLQLLRDSKASFVINAAGFTGRPNVDACETARAETIAGNTLLPLTIANACAAANIPWGHVSSGCIYAGAFVRDRLEKDLSERQLSSAIPSSTTTSIPCRTERSVCAPASIFGSGGPISVFTTLPILALSRRGRSQR